MARLFFASTVTIGLLLGMVAGVLLAAMVAMDQVNVGLAIALTIAINGVIWLISPWLTDFTLRCANGITFLSDDDLKKRYPGVHQLIHQVAGEYQFTAPRIGIIPDRNPTAFTYGLLRSNARVVLTLGIFEYLNDEETKAVVAHELGHIVHRDFAVMTAAGTLVQILYQVYASLSRSGRSSGDKKGNGTAVVAVAAIVFYYIGIYLLFYLSRTREYLADSFSAERIEGRHLAAALVKIAYGIVKVEDTTSTQSLLRSTRHMGVMDVQNARHVGLLAESETATPEQTSEAMLFDAYNPWARIVELNSTHPLTGLRIQHLADIAKQKGQQFGDYDVEAAAARVRIDKAALWSQFWREFAIVLAPVAAAVLVGLLAGWPFAPAAAAATLIATLRMRYPQGTVPDTTVIALMTNPAASPVIGRPARLQGSAIGRVNPGFFAGEDVIYRDKTGIMAVDFRSMLGKIGDFFTGWLRIPKHLEKPGTASGWFRRGMGGYLILMEMTSTGGHLRARPYFWQVVICSIIIAATLFFMVMMGPQRFANSLSEAGKSAQTLERQREPY